MVRVTCNFSGGVELLFNNVKSIDCDLPGSTIKDLIFWLKDQYLKEREELFIQGSTIRPGILVLINDADWSLEGELDYVLQEKDDIVFISTLHGG